MINERYMPLIMDYLEGSLSVAGKQEIQELLDKKIIRQEELEEYRRLIVEVEALPQPEPGPGLREGFYTMMAEVEAEERKPSLLQSWLERLQRWFWSGQVQMGQVLVAALLLILGFGLGFWLRPTQGYEQQISRLENQVVQMQQVAFLTQLEQNSATERLKAVNMSQELPQADQKVIAALLNTLYNDASVNVRLAAIEALRPHAQHPEVREGLVRALEYQDSPLLIVALADEMIALQEKSAVAPMQKLLEQKELDSTVENKLNQSIQILL